MKRFIVFISLLFLAHTALHAQELLTLDEAITRALQHSYDIRIADITAQQAAANNIAANAGLLPTLGATTGGNISSNNTHIAYSDGSVKDVKGASTYSFSLGPTVNFTVFAASRAHLIRRQLREQAKIGDVALKAQMQTTVSQVIQAYALVVNDQQQLIATDTGISLARVRMDLSKAKFDIGTDAKVDYLQGRVDYNASRATRLTQQAARATDRANLRLLMGDSTTTDFTVEDSVTLELGLAPSDEEVVQNNLSLDVARRTADVSKLFVKEARTFYYPSLTLNGGYVYNYTHSDAGVYILNQGFGPTAGVGLNVPIYSGGNIRRQVKVASLQAQSAELSYERQRIALGSQYQSAWENYRSGVADYALERESIGYAKENLDIQEARFRVGIATTVETREAENSYVAALARLANAAYNVKVYETRILELESGLVK